jgi:hypothetical protein
MLETFGASFSYQSWYFCNICTGPSSDIQWSINISFQKGSNSVTIKYLNNVIIQSNTNQLEDQDLQTFVRSEKLEKTEYNGNYKFYNFLN